MSVTSYQWPYHSPLECYKTFLIFFTGTTPGITLGIMSVLQQFSRSPWSWNFDCWQEVAWSSSVINKPPFLHPICTGSHPQLITSICLSVRWGVHTSRLRPWGSVCCWVTHQTSLAGWTPYSQYCRLQAASLWVWQSVLTFFYYKASLGSNFDALGMKIFYVCAQREPFGAVCVSPEIYDNLLAGWDPLIWCHQGFVLCTVSSDYQT